ncbi:hypothetical protein SG34_004125 [Thalassomonas viridans]|uniref:Uncharacterized protein n=1 Tax=Thalassomonas viridans TaxID=137584 RepID=A0AAE9Z3L3_9GAMM|nr:hypothetical protein [Thalassomonas viridans]WDE06126.1 hypothetical protein SG34_004125 [Thalassomonas viridans]
MKQTLTPIGQLQKQTISKNESIYKEPMIMQNLTTEDLKNITGGSSGQKGVDPKVATATPIIQARDISYSGFSNSDEDKNP